MTGLTVIVNSTDSFSDCWDPFFALFAAYWPDCPYQLVLNTELKDFRYSGLNVRASRVGASQVPGSAGWSESLIRCLSYLDTDYILYLQEDYFLNARVDQRLISEYADIIAREQYSHIRLMELPSNEAYSPHPQYPLIWGLPQRAVYRISLQAGLWSRKQLLSYLRPGESGWQFERWGTRRAQATPDSFFCQNLDDFNRSGRYVIPYMPTGLIHGKWYEPAVVDLFDRHRLNMDYSVRGFWRPSPYQRLVQTGRRVVRNAVMRYC
jgi:hypothetical protein